MSTTASATRVCSKCEVEKPKTDFCKDSRASSGCQSSCKVCMNTKAKETRDANPTKNIERKRESRRRSYRNNPAKVALRNEEWRRRNPEAAKAIQQTWKRGNPHSINAMTAKRRAKIINAAPAWAVNSAILIIYAKAKRLSKWLGSEYHVDHIVPLTSKVVCGLHCEANLQIIPAQENLTKSNSYWPHMWATTIKE